MTLSTAAIGAAEGEPKPRKNRRSFTADQKAAVLRRHPGDKVPVSQLCEENDLHPSLFCYWQKRLFENAATALQPPAPDAPSQGPRGEGGGPGEAGRQEVSLPLYGDSSSLRDDDDDALLAAVGRLLTVERHPQQRGDVPRTHADISRAREQLGWAPKTPLAEGLAAAVAWMRVG